MSIERIDNDLCTGCGICIKSCPMDVIRMDEEKNIAVIRYPEDCMLCELCSFDCPEQAITVSPEKHSPVISSWG